MIIYGKLPVTYPTLTTLVCSETSVNLQCSESLNICCLHTVVSPTRPLLCLYTSIDKRRHLPEWTCCFQIRISSEFYCRTMRPLSHCLPVVPPTRRELTDGNVGLNNTRHAEDLTDYSVMQSAVQLSHCMNV